MTRNSRIDLLRGVSILLVVMQHVAMRLNLNEGVLASLLPRRVMDGLFTHGYEAVFVFFVISGFLIASNALAFWGRLDLIELRSFYARRFARIVPALLALVVVLSILHLCSVNRYVIDQPGQSLPGAIASALGFYLNWYEASTGRYLPAGWDVLWSLSIEEVFYLAFPLLCLLLRREWLLVPVLAALALSLPWTRAAAQAGGEIWQQKAYLPGMSAIAVGILAAFLSARVPTMSRSMTRILVALGWLGMGINMFAEDAVWHALHGASMLLWVLSAALLLLGFRWNAKHDARALPGTGWIGSFGRLSYEVYLTHMFVVLAAAAMFRATGATAYWSILWLPPTVAATWLLGKLVECYFSTPCNRGLRRWLIKGRKLPSG
jgi:peptidoglycan/LPS O-acetylase OafA/YrhL